jgi:hypothetical protein
MATRNRGSCRPAQATSTLTLAVPSSPTADEAAGIAWWNELPVLARGLWLSTAGSTCPADAWAAYKAWQARQQVRP